MFQSHLELSLLYDRKDGNIDGTGTGCFICSHVKPMALTRLLEVINHIHHLVSIYVYHVHCNTLSLLRSGTF